MDSKLLSSNTFNFYTASCVAKPFPEFTIDISPSSNCPIGHNFNMNYLEVGLVVALLDTDPVAAEEALKAYIKRLIGTALKMSCGETAMDALANMAREHGNIVCITGIFSERLNRAIACVIRDHLANHYNLYGMSHDRANYRFGTEKHYMVIGTTPVSTGPKAIFMRDIGAYLAKIGYTLRHTNDAAGRVFSRGVPKEMVQVFDERDVTERSRFMAHVCYKKNAYAKLSNHFQDMTRQAKMKHAVVSAAMFGKPYENAASPPEFLIVNTKDHANSSGSIVHNRAYASTAIRIAETATANFTRIYNINRNDDFLRFKKHIGSH